MRHKTKTCRTCGKILPARHRLNTCFGRCEKTFMGQSGKRTFFGEIVEDIL